MGVKQAIYFFACEICTSIRCSRFICEFHLDEIILFRLYYSESREDAIPQHEHLNGSIRHLSPLANKIPVKFDFVQ